MQTIDDGLNVTETLALLDELRIAVEGLQGVRVNIETNNRSVSAAKADITRKLLYTVHLADCVRVDIMSHYHKFKGENPPFMSV